MTLQQSRATARGTHGLCRGLARLGFACWFLGAIGCGRDSEWDLPFVRGDTLGLTGSVAVVDQRRDELMMLTSPRKNELGVGRIPIGKNIVHAVASHDRERLLVLSRGVFPRLERSDERPRLSVVSGGSSPALLRQYELGDPLRKLAQDPEGEFVVAYDAEGAVVNVNELMLVHLAEPERDAIPLTIQSTGGEPQRFTFTAALTTAGGEKHRLLVIETAQDVSIIDLANPTHSEITVPLPSTRMGVARPAQVVFHDDLPGDDEVASYLAVRFANDSNVLTLRLGPPRAGSSSAFSLIPNMVDAGAQPSTIDFVETERGLRLAALVPSRRQAVLFDPATSKSELVEFEQPYSGLARVTGLVSEQTESGDVALLYSDSAPSIAFWRLGTASSTPYASFEDYPVDNRVSRVIDVPGSAYAHLKLLTAATGDQFFLLDLKSRLSHPMRALSGFSLRLSPDGERAWAFAEGGTEFAQLRFENKHPVTVAVQRPVFDLFDIAHGAGGGRALLALHDVGSFGSDDLAVTLLDAEDPDSAETQFRSGLMLEGW